MTNVASATRPRRAPSTAARPAPDRAADLRPRLDGVTPSRVGLRLDTNVHFAQWVEIGRRVRAHEDASLWWLGDWLNFGKRMFGGRYRRGVDLTGLEYQTLRNYAMIARRFEVSRRRDKLTFHHHAEVCALSSAEQDTWLDRAEREHWTRNELRRRLRQERQQETAEAIALKVIVGADCKVRWQAAASASGLALDSWIIHTLDAAALRLLT